MIAFAKPNNVIDFPQPQGKSNEWYTPSRYIEAAREVLGGIDLDPASCEAANRVVKAKQYYTKEQDGLARPWVARSVWLNPPYGKLANKSMLEMWVRRLIQHYEQGSIEQAILLSTTNVESPWFRFLWDYHICFVDHEIRFMHPNGVRKCHLFGSIFVYLGPHEQRFIDIFQQFGTIAKRVSTPKTQPITPSLWETQGESAHGCI
jgi:ParB family transcriptional regulator, chromosome partitioning protein